MNQAIKTTITMLGELLHVVNTVTHTNQLEGKRHVFDMHVWGISGYCGTAGCALGSYAFSKIGQARGITLGVNGNDPHRLEPVYDGKHPSCYEDTIAGAAKKFGIAYEEALFMFDPEEYSADMNTADESIPHEAVIEHITTIREKYISLLMERV